jgi:hypothetical protein
MTQFYSATERSKKVTVIQDSTLMMRSIFLPLIFNSYTH